MMQLTLYHYWRSSSSWRVRMGLAYKGLTPSFVAVNLLTGEQNSPEHLKRNPNGLVPCLGVTDGKKTSYVNESVAILEWLDETYPQNPLLPSDATARARVRELVQIVNADTQPLQNLRVLKAYSADDAERAHWARQWIESGFHAYETLIKAQNVPYSFGDGVTMADLFLVPQVYNAGRFNLDLAPFPTIKKIYSHLLKEQFCQNSAPDHFDPARKST
jgi:maleylacetoacetate isomerase